MITNLRMELFQALVLSVLSGAEYFNLCRRKKTIEFHLSRLPAAGQTGQDITTLATIASRASCYSTGGLVRCF